MCKMQNSKCIIVVSPSGIIEIGCAPVFDTVILSGMEWSDPYPLKPATGKRIRPLASLGMTAFRGDNTGFGEACFESDG